MPDDFRQTPPDLPVPVDDGAADHLAGLALPPLLLPSTLGGTFDLGVQAGLLVAYVYPRTGRPGEPLPEALALPTFTAAGMRLYRRLTLVARDGRIERVFYPVFPPERNAEDVLAWLKAAG